MRGEQPRTIGEIFDENEQPDDDKFIADKLAERKELGLPDDSVTEAIQPEVPVESELETVGGGKTEAGSQCMHPNKTPARQRTVRGKKGFWRKCKDCGALIKPDTSQSRADYHGARAPSGTNVRTHEAEDRKR